MIKYSLKCQKCSIEFESWFISSKEFERLKKLKFLNCEKCGSLNVEKSLMSPNLAKTKKNSINNSNLKFKEVKKKLKDYQKFVKENFELLEQNIQLNNISNIIIQNTAVSKDSSFVKIFLDDDFSAHSMYQENKNSINVKSYSFSDIIKNNGFNI